MIGVLRFCKKGMLSHLYVGPYEILQVVGQAAYELKLPSELSSIYPVFHVSLLKKCIDDPESILPIEDLGVKDDHSYEKFMFKVLDRQVKKLRNKAVVFVKVLWKNHVVEGVTWGAKVSMNSH
ncbi:hypothetical protein EJD97_006014 [Solanum chilense]|uniref:Tf2-1-like SH3-like domain-containing protein n=1 Tax=Solanum chilense TaxID=4083 RepID=A0A6N2BU93_SOLCI|nr:hypothetical protein EJD97_006014 [Solanum chilense]